MNEKFWDLKIDKQNRIINAALKIFARSGFQHASTDEIVSEADISKGLLFHYFISKAGLYEFLIEYSTRYQLLEISSRTKDCPALFYDLLKHFVEIDAAVMDQYPHMPIFWERAYKETHKPTFLKEFPVSAELMRQLQAKKYEMFSTAVLPGQLSTKDAEVLINTLAYVRSGLLEHMQILSSVDPAKYTEEMVHYLDVLSKLTK